MSSTEFKMRAPMCSVNAMNLELELELGTNQWFFMNFGGTNE